MGRKIKLIGADFSANSFPPSNEYTCADLLTSKGFYQAASDGQSIAYNDRPTGDWRSAILELHDNMYIENATSASYEGVVAGSVNPIPSVAFLTSDSVSGFMPGKNIFAHSGSSSVLFATYTGTLTPPAGATHVIINTHLGQGGDADAIIAWD